ncbi:HAMP domain-containing sensor histidine kinase [Pedobacter nyackensis]|uniref:sensor histidine kinase n=1 Tax=Pedobacter nyackensis TaxID=475255 RepID=UPI00292EE9B5|nr:HAMP domain-containing sensor histidine kinase [Pedobacter nyackensis]
MGNMKLLDKPLKAFATYALVVLICSIPVYFFIIDKIWIHEINEHNLIVAESTKKNLLKLNFNEQQLEESVKLWNSLQPETKLQQVNGLKPDSTYNLYRENTYMPDKGYDRYHGLVTYFNIGSKPYSLTVETNIEESYETIAAITAITVLFFIILLIGFIKLNKRISAKLWMPFYQTLEKIKAFDLNQQQTIPFEKSDITEFEVMNTSINKLIESNVAVFRQQKEFTENASHELQTPLAVVQGKLDLLIQSDAITAEQSVIIEETNNALSRISRINKNLLLLAKIENQQFLEKEKINLAEPLQEILELLSDMLEDKLLYLDLSQDCFVEGNRILVEIMLTNLLVNSIRHTGPKAQINISLKTDRLVISNTGSSTLETEKLFKRFSSAAIQTPGSGLGLSIVKEICKRYNWDIQYDYIEDLHTFTVSF